MIVARRTARLLTLVRCTASSDGCSYEEYVRRRLRLEAVEKISVLKGKEKFAGQPSLQREIANYLTTLNEGDTNSSQERKYEVMFADVFGDDDRFEQKLHSIKAQFENNSKQLDHFLTTKGKAYPNIKKFIELIKEPGTGAEINCNSSHL
eukprot:TRINITY_DN6099_c0_g1_i2.p1 TRINITY_DN6099_c0_g1~~TRINITY_DN6099_c0_g1_i2.p1  ORF type:complete len:150 (+),score=29.57 TRINITY_DN6099_c0_g1_i2:192-641(+)